MEKHLPSCTYGPDGGCTLDCLIARGAFVPSAVREILADSLTDRGMRQWWTGYNRVLDDRPCDVWEAGAEKAVVIAANAYIEGVYL